MKERFYKVIYMEGKPLIVREASKAAAKRHGIESKKQFFPWESSKVEDVQEITPEAFKAAADLATKAFLAEMNI